MTITDLKIKLSNELPKDYNLDSYDEGDRIGYNLENNVSFWTFYFCDERGNISEKKKFKTECEACDYIYDYMKNKYQIFIDAVKKQKKYKIKTLPTPKVIYLGNDLHNDKDNNN